MTPWTTASQASLSITKSRTLLKLMLIESVMPSNHLILCHPLLLLPSIFPSMDWLDLLAIKGTLKSVLQHLSSKASILQCSAFFIVQLSHSYITTRKTVALTRWTFVRKIMSLHFFFHPLYFFFIFFYFFLFVVDFVIH